MDDADKLKPQFTGIIVIRRLRVICAPCSIAGAVHLSLFKY